MIKTSKHIEMGWILDAASLSRRSFRSIANWHKQKQGETYYYFTLIDDPSFCGWA